jgi:signal transduction histidine kinase
MRDACQADPQWFLAGPRVPRPRPEERLAPDADVHLPRPSAEPLPFEIFAYDEQFTPTSVAGPRFPDDFKRAMRSSQTVRQVSGEYASAAGTGLQTAIATGWRPGPCAVLLFRQEPAPNRAWTQMGLFLGLVGVCFLAAWGATRRTEARVHRLSQETRASATHDYADIVHVSGEDEIGSLGALFNDTAADIRRKAADARDREEALRRYVENTTADVAEPLAGLERKLSLVMAARRDPDTVEAVLEAHRLAMQLQNQAAVVRLRGISEDSPRETVDLPGVVARLVADRSALAAAAGVTLDASRAAAPATVEADASLIELAIANVLDNAIIYNRAGGSVRVTLQAYEHGRRFRLVIADTGPGVSDEEFAGLTANKRFRGDESRSRRPGGRGLGLALAREISDRFGLQLDLRQPTTGGMEAEFATRA